jgi:hypothetical protein
VSGVVRKPGSSVRFSPPHADHLPDRTYLLKVPTAYEAVEFEERVEIDGARQRFPLDLAKTFQTEARKMVIADPDPEGAEPFLLPVSAWIERLKAAGRAVASQTSPPPEVVAEFWEAARIPDDLAALEEELFERSPTWRTVSVRQRTYRRRRGLSAVAAFLVGWEGEDGLPEFRREGDDVPDELVALLHPEHLVAIADEVDTLLRPSAATLKNSPSASSSESSTTPSTPTPATGRTTRRPNGRSPSAPGSSTTSDGETSASTPPSS